MSPSMTTFLLTCVPMKNKVLESRACGLYPVGSRVSSMSLDIESVDVSKGTHVT